jgi:hypothetical protein
MSREEIGDSGVVLKDILNGIEITIPTKVDALAYLPFVTKSVVWGFVEAIGVYIVATAINVHNLSDGDIILLFFIGSCTIIGVSIIYRWLWKLYGKEIIALTPSKLTIKRDIFGYGHKRFYDLNRISNLWVSYEGTGREGDPSGGAIIFDYDSNTFRFGHSLNEQEAKFVVSELYKRHRFQTG